MAKARYRYRCAYIRSAKLKVPLVEVKRVSEGIAVLEALGVGSMFLESADAGGVFTIEMPLELLSLSAESFWARADAEMDIAIARAERLAGRKVDPNDRGRWPSCSELTRFKLNRLGEDSLFRLRHFGALRLMKIRISDQIYAVRESERAAIDAGLTREEKAIALEADKNSACRDLLWLA